MVEVRRLPLFLHVGQLRDPRAVLQPLGARLRARRSGAVRPADHGRVHDLPGDHVRGADLGDAARRRRLRLAEPPARRRRGVRPRRHRLVVHPLVLGAGLRQHPQRRAVPAAGGGVQARRGDQLPRRQQRPVRGLPGHRRARRRAGVAGDGDLREDPEVLLLRRHGGAGADAAGDAVRLARRLRLRLQPGGRQPLRRLRRRLRADAAARRRRQGGARPRLLAAARRQPAADPVPRLLDPLPQLGRDAVRRGPRGE